MILGEADGYGTHMPCEVDGFWDINSGRGLNVLGKWLGGTLTSWG